MDSSRGSDNILLADLIQTAPVDCLLIGQQKIETLSDDLSHDLSHDLSRDDCLYDDFENVNNISGFDFRVVEEYRSLVRYYREMPKDMCVQQILRDYASSECDLERIRDQYFYHLKQTKSDFPYGQNAELKRRMFTRTGEPVAFRLAQDIYNIIEVTEGGDCNVLKTMISTAKSGRSSVEHQRTRKNQTAETYKCNCASELSLLKDTVSSLQASVLLLKQTLFASDKERSELNNYTKTSLIDMKTKVSTSSDRILQSVNATKETMRNLTSALTERITEFEDRVRFLEVLFNHDNIVSISRVNDINDVFPQTAYQCDVENSAEFIPLHTSGHQKRLRDDAHEDRHSEKDDISENRGLDMKRDTTVQPIPVRVTRRNSDEQYPAEKPFHVVRHRRISRFCVLGLSARMNTEILKAEIECTGLIVKSIQVFPVKRNPEKVLVKLCVVADDKINLLLSGDFWPSYVTCRPWKTLETIRSERAVQKDASLMKSRKNTQTRRSYSMKSENRKYAPFSYRRQELPPRFNNLWSQKSTVDTTMHMNTNRFSPLDSLTKCEPE